MSSRKEAVSGWIRLGWRVMLAPDRRTKATIKRQPSRIRPKTWEEWR